MKKNYFIRGWRSGAVYRLSHSFSQLSETVSLGICQSPRALKLIVPTFAPSKKQRTSWRKCRSSKTIWRPPAARPGTP